MLHPMPAMRIKRSAVLHVLAYHFINGLMGDMNSFQGKPPRYLARRPFRILDVTASLLLHDITDATVTDTPFSALHCHLLGTVRLITSIPAAVA